MSWPQACVEIAGFIFGAVCVLGLVTFLEGEAIVRAWRNKR